MGQLFIAQGPEAARREIIAASLEVFARTFLLEPTQTLELGDTSIIKLPRLFGEPDPVYQSESGGQILASAGTWFDRQDRDEAALLKAWQKDPSLEETARDLDGLFALALSDGQQLSVVTDRIGTLAFYKTLHQGCVLLSTSSLALAALTQPEWDPSSLREFLATGTVFGQRTLFQGIDKLEPASVYEFEHGRVIGKTRYWGLFELAYDDARSQTKVAELGAALDQSLRRVRGRYPRARVDITGGFDSRAVLGVLLHQNREFETVVNGPDEDPDVRVAGELARAYGLTHHHQKLPENWGELWWTEAKRALTLTDGEHDILEYAGVYWFQSQNAGRYDISVNGSGGEVAKGYWWELLWPHIGGPKFDSERVAQKRFCFDPWSEDLLQFEMPDSVARQIANEMDKANRDLGDSPNTHKMDNVYVRLRMQRWQGRLASATNRVIRNVAPFLFEAPMRACLTARPRIRFNDRMPRLLIEHLDPELAKMPLAEGYPALPIRPSTAHHFLPMAQQFAGKVKRKLLPFLEDDSEHVVAATGFALRDLLDNAEVRDLLTPSQMKTRDLYRPEALDAKLAEFYGDAPFDAYHLGRILTLELLARTI